MLIVAVWLYNISHPVQKVRKRQRPVRSTSVPEVCATEVRSSMSRTQLLERFVHHAPDVRLGKRVGLDLGFHFLLVDFGVFFDLGVGFEG